jgi:ribosomal protein S18 acetylase RimI-like enzyme
VDPTPIQIRHLTSADAMLYRAIRLEALEHDPEAFGSTLDAERDQHIDWFKARLEGSVVFGALRDGEAVGTAGIYFDTAMPPRTGTLWTVYVRPAARGRGLGQRLVDAVIDHVRPQADRIRLKVNSENDAAVQLYLRLGFVRVGIEKDALHRGGRFYDEAVMERVLPR